VKEGRFTILEEHLTIYPHTCLFPMIYIGTVIAEWATVFFPGSTRVPPLKLSEVVNLLNKHSCFQVFTAAPF
jgi:hypothetical protein